MEDFYGLPFDLSAPERPRTDPNPFDRNPSPTPTRTPSPTRTPAPTRTPVPTRTPAPTRTPVPPTPTREPTPTRTPSPTRIPTLQPVGTPRPLPGRGTGVGARGRPIDVIRTPPPDISAAHWARIAAVAFPPEVLAVIDKQDRGEALTDEERATLIQADNDVREAIDSTRRTGDPFPAPAAPAAPAEAAPEATAPEVPDIGAPDPNAPVLGPALPPEISSANYPEERTPGERRGEPMPPYDPSMAPKPPPSIAPPLPAPTAPPARPAAPTAPPVAPPPSKPAPTPPRPAPPVRAAAPAAPSAPPKPAPSATSRSAPPPPPPPPFESDPEGALIDQGPLRGAIETAGGRPTARVAGRVAREISETIPKGYQGQTGGWRTEAAAAARAWEHQYRVAPDTLAPAEKEAYRRDPKSLYANLDNLASSPYRDYLESWIGAYRSGNRDIPMATDLDAQLRGYDEYQSPYDRERPPAPGVVADTGVDVGLGSEETPADLGAPPAEPIPQDIAADSGADVGLSEPIAEMDRLPVEDIAAPEPMPEEAPPEEVDEGSPEEEYGDEDVDEYVE